MCDPFTILMVASTAFKAVSAISNAKSEAKIIAQNASNQAKVNQINAKNQAQANLDAANLASKEKAKQIRYAAARQTTSFLSSGLTLEGTPDAVIGETYSTGLEDLNQISKNANTTNSNLINITNVTNSNLISSANAQSKLTVAKGRAEAIDAIVGGFSNFSMGGSGFQTGGTLAAPTLNSSGKMVGTYKL